jgi:hypothetical protein
MKARHLALSLGVLSLGVVATVTLLESKRRELTHEREKKLGDYLQQIRTQRAQQA